MSLNKFMHPRNRYKNSKPSFLHLALKYPDFRAHTTQDASGKVILDFKNADALRALTTCLLKEDFGLSVELPADRLVPTLPLRLNYIHWLEDIVGTNENIWGIDVGTGASCVYPLLAAKMNKWHFLATEADPENVFYANKNVAANGFQEFIYVKKVSAEDILIAPLQTFTVRTQFDFCMCNPPFFADHMEAQAITNTRSADRPEASTLSTASPQECIAQGGEVGFVRQMIDESTVLRDKIRVFTSMVGKKSSLAPLKAELLHQKVAKYSTTEFCQGKTMRWGIAWTYDSSVTFPRSEFESRKEKPPIQYMVPKGAGGVDYKVHEVAAYLKQLLESVKVHCFQGKKAKSYTSITLTAAENTWCHQRRLRRQQMRTQQQEKAEHGTLVQNPAPKDSPVKNGEHVPVSSREDPSSKPSRPEDVLSIDNAHLDKDSDVKYDSDIQSRKRPAEQSVIDAAESFKRPRQDTAESEMTEKTEPERNEQTVTRSPEKTAPSDVSLIALDRDKLEATEPYSVESHNQPVETVPSDVSMTAVDGERFKATEPSSISGHIQPVVSSEQSSINGQNQPAVSSESKAEDGSADSSPKEYVLKCVMRLKRKDDQVQLELEYLGGQSRELMYQLFTFLKNKLTQSAK
ncbi:unnamed protein product [Candidula unifasciata]|uniref:U6 snRNA m(6)A methyltransferase n=1 Tax=Candidula unifasciata TaxID=100452 RepID=A0A8S4ACH8_9EUPU|nr:unnamed protein product [Candidula unifasciata]